MHAWAVQGKNNTGIQEIQEGSIRVRILHHGTDDRPEDFWHQAIDRAYHTRKVILSTTPAATNAYRLVHGAGDLLPLIIGLSRMFFNLFAKEMSNGMLDLPRR